MQNLFHDLLLLPICIQFLER